MLITKKKITIIALSFITAISTLFGALLLTPTTAKAEETTSEYETYAGSITVEDEKYVYKISCFNPRGLVDDSCFDEYVVFVSFKNLSGCQIYFVDGKVCNMEDSSDGDYEWNEYANYYDILYYDATNHFVYIRFKNLAYLEGDENVSADLGDFSIRIEETTYNPFPQRILYEFYEPTEDPEDPITPPTEDPEEEPTERPDPGAGVPGLARYENHYISGQYWRVYGSKTRACDNNLDLNFMCVTGSLPLEIYASDSIIKVNFKTNTLIQYQYKEKGQVIYTDFYMPETIVSTTGNYLTSNLVIHSDYVDYIYLITDPQIVCPTVYAQVNVTPEEPGQSPTLPGEPEFPSTEDPSNPGTDDPSNPGSETPLRDKIKGWLEDATKWFNDYTGLGVSSSIVGLAVILIIVALLRRRR